MNYLRTAACTLALAGLAGLTHLARAGDDEGCLSEHAVQKDGPAPRVAPGFDADSGRDTRTYPPDRIADFQHMKLEIDIPDMNRPHLSAVETLSFAPLGHDLAELSLDAKLMEVHEVSSPGHKVSFKHDGHVLRVSFDPPVPAGATALLTTKYEVDDPPQGLTWTPESPAWPGRPAQLHSQGEAQSNSYWFPCHDFPNERLTTELIATVPGDFAVSANGKMAEPPIHSGEGSQKRITYHWLQDKPHVNYLVSMIVGKFDVVDVAMPEQGQGKALVPMPVYVPPGRGGDVFRTYGRTPQMVSLFGKLTGQPYAWDRYAQLVVWNFGAGGMENTSATTLYDTAVLTPEGLADGDLDGLISHELAHQWFGDLITCKSWEHIWLNEGFATYFTNLWFEHRDAGGSPEDGSNDAYQAGVIGNFDAVIDRDKPDAPYMQAMVSKEYTDPGQPFGWAAGAYPKGASILNMLRQRLGDELFFKGLAAYVARYKLQNTETNDLRRALEEVSGDSLEQFFHQWCYRPGVPDLDIELKWDETASELVVSVNQKQQIDGYNSAFAFALPIWVEGGHGSPAAKAALSRGSLVSMEISTNSTEARFKLDAEPDLVAIDPLMAVLAKMTIKQPLRNWVAQLERGPTLASRVQAARAMSADTSPASRASLLNVARDARSHTKLRSVAIESLRHRNDAPALVELADPAPQAADVRVALVDAIAVLAAAGEIEASQRTRLKELLADHAANDTSFRARASALRGLGKTKAIDHLSVILAGADTDSQHDRVRQGALEALGDMDSSEGLQVVLRYSLPGAYNRTRPIAIAALGKLAHHDPDTVFKVLVTLLSDRERRVWEAAGDALAKLDDPRAQEEFQKLASAKRDEGDKKKIAAWEERIGKHASR